MSASTRNLAIVVTVGLVIRAWDAFGPFLVSPGPFDPPTTPGDRALAFGFYLLWVGVLAITYRRDPHGRMWKLLLLAFLTDGTWVLSWIQTRTGIGWTLALFLLPLTTAVLLHLCLAFPTGRLRDRLDRWVVGAAYVLVLPVWLLRWMVWDPGFPPCPEAATWCAQNVLLVAPNADLAALLLNMGYLAPVFTVLVVVELVRHWRRASPAGRRALAPVAFGMPIVFVINGANLLAQSVGNTGVTEFLTSYRLFDIPSYLAPALFLIGTVRARLARGSLTDLALELGRGVPLGGLRDALARTLRDPTLQLAFAAPAGGGLVDAEGRQFELPTSVDRAATRVEHDGELLAVLVHDPAIDREDRGLVDAVGSVAQLALRNERLSAQVRAQLQEVRKSRQRIVEAGDHERHRIERDLHDGAQQRLVALAMRLEAARGGASDAAALIDATTAELATAIGEVRQLARGLHPAILSEAGLRAAIESLAERTPFPVEIEADDARYPAELETTAYYVVAESLTNVAKHARATHARVILRREAGSLVVEVTDDGVGGADPSVGSGLRGLADRVAAAGGELDVDSTPGRGTMLRARIPV